MSLKKLISKSIALALVGVTIINFRIDTIAAISKSNNISIEQNEEISKEEINKLVDKYDIKVSKTNITLDDLPTGVEPIIVNSIDELDEALSRMNGTLNTSNNIVEENLNTYSMSRATKLATFSKGLGLTIGNFSTAKFNVYASLEVSGGKITGVNYKDQSLTGYTLGLSLTKGSTSCKVSSDKKSATVRGTGTINGYIFIEGIGNIYSKDYTVSGTYKVQ